MANKKNNAPGGKAVYDQRGSDYMSELGRKGAKSIWTKWVRLPIGQSEYVMVRKENVK